MKTLLPALLGLAALATPALAADAIEPGYWDVTNRVLSPIRTKQVEKRCITPAEVAKFMMGPSNRHYKCTYPTRNFSGGKILLKGTCTKKNQTLAVDGTGTWSPTSFALTAHVATEVLGIPVVAKASTEATRIGDVCPPPPAPKPRRG